jgi:hypothetical protein
VTPIPSKIRRELEGLDRMKRCARCGAQPVEWHHAITGMGRKKFQDAWSILALCTRCHRGADKNDELARHLAYSQISDEDLKRYKLGEGMIQEKHYLNSKYNV